MGLWPVFASETRTLCLTQSKEIAPSVFSPLVSLVLRLRFNCPASTPRSSPPTPSFPRHGPAWPGREQLASCAAAFPEKAFITPTKYDPVQISSAHSFAAAFPACILEPRQSGLCL